MPYVIGMLGRCVLCDKPFYAPYGHDGDPYGVAFEDGRISRNGTGQPCTSCLKMLWDWGGPVWRDKPYWWDRSHENDPEGDEVLLPIDQQRTQP